MNQTQRDDVRKLAAAIRDGASKTQQLKGSYLGWNPNDEIVMACAIGAAAISLDGENIKINQCQYIANSKIRSIIAQSLPDLPFDLRCPLCGIPDRTASLVEHLNDYHGWPRETTAAWLDQLVESDEIGEALAEGLFERPLTMIESVSPVVTLPAIA